MERGKRKGKENRKGSATIEAVLCLTIFMVAIMTILSFINICRAQAAVSYAMDATAKEMSQYAYFFHISGLEELQKTTIDKTKESREQASQIVGGTEAIFKVFGTFSSGEASSKDIDKEGDGGESKQGEAITMGNAASKIKEMTAAVASIDNPMEFIKNMVTVGAMKATSYIRSQLIAAPMAKALMKKHFEVDGMGADDYLRSLRIDGMDALNLQMSTIFAPTTPDDIHLICYYEVKPAQFFNFDFGTVVLCKESVTRAWLSGDKIYEGQDEVDEDKLSIWDMKSTEYGKYIVGKEREKLLKKGCYDIRGSGADAFNPENNTIYHIRSMDIYSDTYKDANAVKNTLRQEYNKVASLMESDKDTIDVKEKGETKTFTSHKENRKLHIIIVRPEGDETTAFKDGLEAAFGELEKEGKLTVDVVPGYGISHKDPKHMNDVPKEEENP